MLCCAVPLPPCGPPSLLQALVGLCQRVSKPAVDSGLHSCSVNCISMCEPVTAICTLPSKCSSGTRRQSQARATHAVVPSQFASGQVSRKLPLFQPWEPNRRVPLQAQPRGRPASAQLEACALVLAACPGSATCLLLWKQRPSSQTGLTLLLSGPSHQVCFDPVCLATRQLPSLRPQDSLPISPCSSRATSLRTRLPSFPDRTTACVSLFIFSEMVLPPTLKCYVLTIMY